MPEFSWEVIVSGILAVVSVVFGVFWAKARDKLFALSALFRVIEQAIGDTKITPEEAEAIVDAWHELMGR